MKTPIKLIVYTTVRRRRGAAGGVNSCDTEGTSGRWAASASRRGGRLKAPEMSISHKGEDDDTNGRARSDCRECLLTNAELLSNTRSQSRDATLVHKRTTQIKDEGQSVTYYIGPRPSAHCFAVSYLDPGITPGWPSASQGGREAGG